MKRWFPQNTPFEKAKPVERPGTESHGATGGLPRPPKPAELPRGASGPTTAHHVSKGGPLRKDPLFIPEGRSARCSTGPHHLCYAALVIRPDELLITEIFHSLQGETTLVGVPFAFIRLTGCNLRCSYCDTAYAFKGKEKKTISKILNEISSYGVAHVLITGGEPLLQRNTPRLVDELVDAGYKVSIETHGELSIQDVADKARIILDIKTPSSGMSRGGYRNNLPLLKKEDEIKFVIASEADYVWARDIVRAGLPEVEAVLFSPAMPNAHAPGAYSGVAPRWLAERILEDRLPVRMQFQLHKLLWGPNQRGV